MLNFLVGTSAGVEMAQMVKAQDFYARKLVFEFESPWIKISRSINYLCL